MSARKPRYLSLREVSVCITMGGDASQWIAILLDGDTNVPLITLKQARRLRDWLTRAIEWMEAQPTTPGAPRRIR